MNKELIPEIGKTYYFYDNGMLKYSRQYKAIVLNIIPFEESKTTKIIGEYTKECSTLYEVWRKEVESNCTDNYFRVFKFNNKPGLPYLYANETDYFVECSIPEYDDNNIWFVRTVDGDWFSLDIQNDWQSGQLDVSGNLTEKLEKISL